MHVIVVTPLMRGTKIESLSYFSSTPYDVGSFVRVPIRGKTQCAIVTATRPATASKSALKAATFSLRKLPQQKGTVALPEPLRLTATHLSHTYPATIGSLLFQLLPPDIRNGIQAYPTPTTHPSKSTYAPELLTAKIDDRIIAYQSIVRSCFARQESAMIVVPTAAYISELQEKLSGGITDRLVIFSPLQTKRQRNTAFDAFTSKEQAVLILCTPAHAYLYRNDIGQYIIEQSGSSHYVTRTRPYLDHREGILTLARVTSSAALLGDTVPLTEHEYTRRMGTFETHGETAKRIAFPAPLSVVTQKDKATPEIPFQLFSDELLHATTRALEGRGRVFLFAARRGLAPVVFCLDCSHIFRCPDSGTPYSLMRTHNGTEEERWFISSTSGRKVRAADTCTVCGSWRLRERGIGIQHAANEWIERYGTDGLTVIDQSTAKSSKEIEKQCRAFFEQKSGVLIATQVALPYISRGVAVSGIISLDATRSIPTWRADESLFRLLLRLRECSSQEVIVQTREKAETDNLLTYASRGAIERFYNDEIELRQMVQYPPLCTFILLTWMGSEKTVHETESLVIHTTQLSTLQCYNNPNSTKTNVIRHCLIRTDKSDTARYDTLLSQLQSLPPYIKVEVNPERIV